MRHGTESFGTSDVLSIIEANRVEVVALGLCDKPCSLVSS